MCINGSLQIHRITENKFEVYMEQSYNDNKKWKVILLKFSHSSFT